MANPLNGNDTNGSALAERNKGGQWLRGHRGLGGRPVGARNKLATRFLDDLEKQWRKSGKRALERTAEDDPVSFTKIVAGLLPREIASTLDVSVDLTAARTRIQMYQYARDFIHAENEPPLIESQPIEIDNEQADD